MPIVLSSIHEVLQFVMEKVDESLKTLLEKIKPALIQAVSESSRACPLKAFVVEGGQVDPAVRGQGAGRQAALGGFGRCFLRPSRLQHHFGQGSEDL